MDCAYREGFPEIINQFWESETTGEMLVEQSLRSPLSFPKEPGFWSKNVYFFSFLKVLRQTPNNASSHGIAQQAHLSFNLICFEQVEAGYKAAMPKEWKCSMFSDYRNP